MPDEIAERTDVHYLAAAQACGLSVADLERLTYSQALGVIELHEFVRDANEYREEDAAARAGEKAFFG